jgi:UDP-2,3-diacylglucosamine pyrophosphatase LpxH
MYYHSIIISDIHLGNESCNYNSLLKVLKKEKYDNLIINGDLFDSKYLHRLNKHHWKILSKLRKISKNKNIIFLTGNHDFYAEQNFASLLGITVKKYHELIVNNKKIYITHGDVFDYFMSDNLSWLSRLTSELYYFICKNNFLRKYLNQFLHDKTKQLFKVDRKMKEGALNFAQKNNYDVIICGHTHFPEIQIKNNILYANSGCFVIDKPTYLTLTYNGILNVKSCF